MFSTGNQEWRTPPWLLRHLEERIGFRFVLDAAATDENTLCENWYTREQNALAQDWADEVYRLEMRPGLGAVWCNPPYGHSESLRWAKKGYETGQAGTAVAMLLPARTDTEFFHRYVAGKAIIYFIEGRLKFSDATAGAPFPSIVAVWLSAEPVVRYDIIQQPDELFRGPRPSTKWRRQ